MAVVASPLNLKRVTVSANDSKKRVTEARNSIKNVGQIIFRRTKVKRDAFTQTNLFRKRREENEKRMALEDELEAPRTVVTPGGPQKLAQAGVGGFFDRIFGFLGYLAAGWLMSNLPTWIAMGKEFIARIQKAGQIVSGFFNNTIKLFINVENVLGALGQNLLRFDFFDTSNRVKDAMSGLNTTVGNLTNQIEEAFGLLTTPLTEGKYSGEKIPETGTQQTDEGAYATPPPYSGSTPSGGGTKYPDLASLVVRGEGGINSVNRGNAGDTPGGAKSIFGKNLTDMTIGEIMQAQREGRVFAVGKYQFIPDTLAGAVKYTKVPLNAKFNSATQNRLFDYLIDVKRPEIGAYINGKSNDRRTAVQQLAREFASVGLEYPEAGRVRGQSRYAGTGRNRASISPEAAASVIDKQRRGGPSQQPSQSGSQPTVVSAGSAQYTKGNWETGSGFNPAGAKDVYGRPIVLSRTAAEAFAAMMRDSGGKVKGSDVASSQRSPAKNERVGGATQSKHLKGLALDIHGSSNSWIRKFGSRYGWVANDYSGSHGGHFEFRGGSTSNVSAPTPAQMSAPPQQSVMVPFSLTPERRGQDIMIIEPQQQQNIITPASGGGDMAPSPINDFDLLNNFIKNKLLLDLAYL
jgi:hypothetical protein